MEHTLSIEESLRFGWAKTKEHSGIIFQVLLTLIALQMVQQVVMRLFNGMPEGTVDTAILFVLSVLLGIGFTRITMLITEGKHARYQDIIPPIGLAVAYAGATILAGLITLLPLVGALVLSVVAYTLLPYTAATVVSAVVVAAALVAAVYFILRYALVRFAILDDVGMVKSLRTSALATRGRKWWLLGFFITLILINLLGVMLLFVGLLLTVPISMFAFALVYVKLHTHH